MVSNVIVGSVNLFCIGLRIEKTTVHVGSVEVKNSNFSLKIVL